jgi:prolyl-tRNA synthetase
MDKKEYGLGATHEEAVTPLVKRHISSYKELPVCVYQIQTKFRNELRAKAGLLRGREFSMKDLYSFHASQEDLDNFYDQAKQSYFNIFKKVNLGDITYLTYASGGAFSEYSHEFQTLSEAGEDTIYICDKCHMAINKEIIDDIKNCPECGNDNLRQAKAVEVGNIFKLSNRFSKPFNLTYTDNKGVIKEVLMSCFGLGPSRLMGTIVEVHHDDKGIIWPEHIAPFQFHLISLNKKSEADKIYNDLIKNKLEVLYDDREINAGEKFADADLIGLPHRIVISEKSIQAGGVEVKARTAKDSQIIKITEFIKYCQNL